MTRPRRLLPTTVLLVALLAALAFASGSAAAEIRSGEGASPVEPEIPGGTDILGATASYDATDGVVTLTVTTREPTSTTEQFVVGGGLGVQGTECGYPTMAIAGASNGSTAAWAIVESEQEFEEGITGEPGQKSVAGSTTTLIASSPRLAGKPYNCADVSVEGLEEGELEVFDELTFPLSNIVQTAPPPTVTTQPPATATTIPTPAPTPAALSIAKLKPLKLKVGRWTKLKVRISDPGGVATGPGTLKVKAPKGIVLKPAAGKLKLPALEPGATQTLSFEARPTEGAKPRSKLSLTATVPGLTAESSVVMKLTG